MLTAVVTLAVVVTLAAVALVGAASLKRPTTPTQDEWDALVGEIEARHEAEDDFRHGGTNGKW